MTSPLRLAAIGLAYFLALLVVIQVVQAFGSHDLMDFGIFMHAGEAAREGLNPYVLYPELRFYPESGALNLNPPISVVFFREIVAFDVESSRTVLRVLLLVSFLATLVLLVRHYRLGALGTALVALGSQPSGGIITGQITSLLALPFTGAWFFLQAERWVLAGVLMGIVASVKPPFALWPLLLLLGGHHKAAIPALVTGAVIGAIPAIVFGPTVYTEWLSVPVDDSLAFYWPFNVSLVALTGSWSFGIGLAGLAGIVAAAWIWREKPNAMRVSAIAVLLVLLTGPISWRGYLTFSMPLVLSRTRGVTFWASLVLMVFGLHAFVTYLLLAIVVREEWQLRKRATVEHQFADPAALERVA